MTRANHDVLVDPSQRARRGRRSRPVVLAVLAAGLAVPAGLMGASPPLFTDTLTPAERTAMGIAKLTPPELAALNAAVEQYRHESASHAAEKAAAAAVSEYRRREEPKVVAQAVAVVKERAAEQRQERFSAHIVGSFSGWEGQTIFRLDNGQVWQQVGSDLYYISPQKSPRIDIYHSEYGSFRMSLTNGVWVTVVRLR